MHAYFFPNLKIFTFNLSSTVLYFSRNKHTLSHFVQGLKIPTKQIPTKQFFTSRVVEHTRGLPSKKLKLRLLQWESSASWMNHNVSESWRPMLVLFTLPENCPTTECFLVPFFSISEYRAQLSAFFPQFRSELPGLGFIVGVVGIHKSSIGYLLPILLLINRVCVSFRALMQVLSWFFRLAGSFSLIKELLSLTITNDQMSANCIPSQPTVYLVQSKIIRDFTMN